MVINYMLRKVFEKKEETIYIVKLDDTKNLTDTDDKLPDCVFLEIVVILITCMIKNAGTFQPQIFLEEALYNE